MEDVKKESVCLIVEYWLIIQGCVQPKQNSIHGATFIETTILFLEITNHYTLSIYKTFLISPNLLSYLALTFCYLTVAFCYLAPTFCYLASSLKSVAPLSPYISCFCPLTYFRILK